MTAPNFIEGEVLKIENRLFLGKLFGSAIGYALVTLGLNSIRATASLWIVWALIIIQSVLYFSIFIVSYQRSKVFGLSNNLALVISIVLAVLGRVNDLELVVIPLLVIVMFIFSVGNKRISKAGRSMLPEK